jgi:HpcH/HpaI aldolase/citrate lyase family
MIDLLTITNQPALAERCDLLPGMRLFVDLERNGKAERQAGRDTFISGHQMADVGRVKAVLKRSRLMVRVNPYQSQTPAAARDEVDEVLAHGADMLMLPMFSKADELRAFADLVAGRAPIVPLLETAGALACLDDWLDTPGLGEVFVGLNDLHLSLGCRFMFEPLLQGHVDRVASAARRQGLRFGFGGIARVEEGLLRGSDVLAEHVRMGSGAVILSRTFTRPHGEASFEQAVADLRIAEQQLALRTFPQVHADHQRVAQLIGDLAQLVRTP